MRSKQYLNKVIVMAVIVTAVFALATCQKKNQVEEATPTLEPEVQTTMEPETMAEEPTVAQAEEPQSDTEAAPPEVPAITTADMVEYVSVTEFFTVKVPAGWSSEETLSGGAFIMANSEAALERYRNDSPADSGDFVLNIGFLPYELFQQREVKHLDIQFEATPDIFLQSLLPMFNTTGDAILSDIELVSINDERDAGMLTVSDEGREGLILMFVAGDGVVAFVSTSGFLGEMAEFQEIAYAVVSEVTFSGAHEALYGRLLGG